MRKKLVFLVVALMMLAVPASAFARDVNVNNAAEFNAAIVDQQPGDVITLAPGTYDIGKGADQAITAGGQPGWFIPVIKDGVTIQGAGARETTITSSVVSPNGAWASQDFFAVFANGVTIKNMTIVPKIETNKAIEIMGKDATLEGLDIVANPLANDPQYADDYGFLGDEQFSGSIYFNPSGSTDPAVAASKDVGNSVLKNVTLAAHISAGTKNVATGQVLLDDVTIDYTHMPYKTWNLTDNGGWGAISSNPLITVGEGGFTVDADNTDYINYTRDILSLVPTNTTVSFAPGEYVFDEGIISRPITIKGASATGTTFDVKNLTVASTGKITPKDAIVIVHPVSIALPATTWAMTKGTTYKAVATVLPANTTNKAVVWSSDDTATASVDANGLITAKAAGKTYINVKTVDGGLSARMALSISNPKATGVILNITKATVKVGKKLTLTAKIAPSNAETSTIAWSSSNSKIASVNSKGVVTMRKTGKVTITAKCVQNPSVKASARITIVRPVTKISVRKARVVLRRGTSWDFRVKAYPKNASNRKVTYRSSSKLVKVNSRGIVYVSKKAKHNMKAVITIKAKDGFGAQRKIYITVTKYRP